MNTAPPPPGPLSAASVSQLAWKSLQQQLATTVLRPLNKTYLISVVKFPASSCCCCLQLNKSKDILFICCFIMKINRLVRKDINRQTFWVMRVINPEKKKIKHLPLLVSKGTNAASSQQEHYKVNISPFLTVVPPTQSF